MLLPGHALSHSGKVQTLLFGTRIFARPVPSMSATIGISYAVQEKLGSVISGWPDLPSKTWKKHWSE